MQAEICATIKTWWAGTCLGGYLCPGTELADMKHRDSVYKGSAPADKLVHQYKQITVMNVPLNILIRDQKTK